MKEFARTLNAICTLAFLYFMLKHEPNLIQAVWMLAIKSGCHYDMWLNHEKKINTSKE